MKKHIANLITLCRIPFSIGMLFLPVFSLPFYLLYLLCGFTDMIDGTVARKTGTAGESGAKLDTAADLLFTAVSMIKLLPVLHLPKWVWIWILGIAGLRIRNLLSSTLRRKTFLSLHTLPNKITGLLLFLFPLTLPFLEVTYSAVVLCTISTVSAIQEGNFKGDFSL